MTTATASAPLVRCTTPLPAHRSEIRTRFCTTRGWFAYRDLTPTMRRAILSAQDGEGCVAGWVTTQTANRLEVMGLVERKGFGVRLTFYGELLWCELDQA